MEEDTIIHRQTSLDLENNVVKDENEEKIKDGALQ